MTTETLKKYCPYCKLSNCFKQCMNDSEFISEDEFLRDSINGLSFMENGNLNNQKDINLFAISILLFFVNNGRKLCLDLNTIMDSWFYN